MLEILGLCFVGAFFYCLGSVEDRKYAARMEEMNREYRELHEEFLRDIEKLKQETPMGE